MIETEAAEIFAVDQAELSAACASDFDTFCAVAGPDVYVSSFPDFFIACFHIITQAALSKVENLTKYAIGIPRAHAKTTFVKFLITWMIVFTKKRYFLVLGASSAKAEDIISDVIGFLESNNIIALFGRWNKDCIKDTIAEKRFRFRGRTITLMAMGMDSPIRGTNKDNQRPDFILMDDVQDEKKAESEQVSDMLFRTILGTVLLAGDPHNCQYIYLGNKYASKHCILTKLQASKEWTSLVVGALLADMEPLWPALHSKESLMSKLRGYQEQGKQEIFFAELMNNVGDMNRTGFKYERIKKFTPEASESPQAKWVIIDPSRGASGSDDQIVGSFEAWDGKPHLSDLLTVNKSAPELVKEVILYCVEKNIPCIFVEDVAYQSTLIQWFEFWFSFYSIEGFQVYPVSPKGRNKNSRILEGLKFLEEGNMTISPKVNSQIVAQIAAFNPLKTKNDDNILDVISYGSESLINFQSEITSAMWMHSDAAILSGYNSDSQLIESSSL